MHVQDATAFARADDGLGFTSRPELGMQRNAPERFISSRGRRAKANDADDTHDMY